MQPVLGHLVVCATFAVCLPSAGRSLAFVRDAWDTTRRRENRMRRSNYIFRMSFLIYSLARRRAQTPYRESPVTVSSTRCHAESENRVHSRQASRTRYGTVQGTSNMYNCTAKPDLSPTKIHRPIDAHAKPVPYVGLRPQEPPSKPTTRASSSTNTH